MRHKLQESISNYTKMMSLFEALFLLSISIILTTEMLDMWITICSRKLGL